MNNKTLAIVSYITIIGWLISFFFQKDQNPKSSLVVYHLKQALGIAILQILLSIVITIVASIIPTVAGILSLIQLIPFILWAIGIINASNEKETPLPLIGTFFENKFNFFG